MALVPSVAAKLVKLGAKLHMQSGAGDAIKLTDAAFKDVAFMDDRKDWSATPMWFSPCSHRRWM